MRLLAVTAATYIKQKQLRRKRKKPITATTHKLFLDRGLVPLELFEPFNPLERVPDIGPRIVGVYWEVRVAKVLQIGEDGGVGHVVRKLRSILIEICASFFCSAERTGVVAAGTTFGERGV